MITEKENLETNDLTKVYPARAKYVSTNQKEPTENQPISQNHEPQNNPKIYQKYVLAIVVVILLIFGAGVKYASYISGVPSGQVANAGYITSVSDFGQKQASTDLVVCIKGAVTKGGYYSITPDTSLRELLDYVGVTSEGDVSDMDFTYKPMDGDTFYIRNKNNPVDIEPWVTNSIVAEPAPTSEESELPSEKLININTATKEELMTLKGIGEVRAEAIINHRSKYGNFLYKEDLLAVNGIGEKTYADMEKFITVD